MEATEAWSGRETSAVREQSTWSKLGRQEKEAKQMLMHHKESREPLSIERDGRVKNVGMKDIGNFRILKQFQIMTTSRV